MKINEVMSGLDLVRDWRSISLKRIKCDLPMHLGLSWDRLHRYMQKTPQYIIGADEVGRGALAGPVTVCAFLARTHWSMDGLRDSKKLSVQRRAEFYPKLKEASIGYHIAEFPNTNIDKWGMRTCLRLLYEECLEQLRNKFPLQFDDAFIVLDGLEQVRYIDHLFLPKGDDIVQQISAASVIAKFHRDRWMATEAHLRYPQYGFDSNVGYGSDFHKEAILKHGPCPLHRVGFLKNKDAWRK